MDKQLTPDAILWDNAAHEIKGYMKDGIIKAMEQYANQQTAALQSRIEELERDNKDLRFWYKTHNEVIKERDTRIAELERENAELVTDRNMYKTAYGHAGDELTESEQLNEKLMGLLEEKIVPDTIIKYLLLGFHKFEAEEKAAYDWQSYCKEKGLTPNKLP